MNFRILNYYILEPSQNNNQHILLMQKYNQYIVVKSKEIK